MPTRFVPPLRQSGDGAGHYCITLNDGTQMLLCNACAHRAVMCDSRLVRAKLLAPQPRACERCQPAGHAEIIPLFSQRE